MFLALAGLVVGVLLFFNGAIRIIAHDEPSTAVYARSMTGFALIAATICAGIFGSLS
jgi:hypothetical protein